MLEMEAAVDDAPDECQSDVSALSVGGFHRLISTCEHVAEEDGRRTHAHLLLRIAPRARALVRLEHLLLARIRVVPHHVVLDVCETAVH